MEIEKLLRPEVQEFIIEKTGTDITRLALQKNPFADIDFRMILNQIEARSKIRLKLPTWFEARNIVYPSKISLEQTSSETTAGYKSGLASPESVIDLTGGFGVDDYYFSKKTEQVVHCEINADLTEIARHNFARLGARNISCVNGDSHEALKSFNRKFGTLYVDPSRRHDAKGKVFLLKDCLPNVPESLDFYFRHTDSILIKTAPLLDISAGLNELESVKSIHVIAVENEVKELLWELEKQYSGKITVQTVNFNKGKIETFAFQWDSEVPSQFGSPKKYLYEPNSAIMKSGGFAQIGAAFNLEKLHLHSHLYTSDNLVDFPGRVFEIHSFFDYSSAGMKRHFSHSQSNITTRNFPETVEKIRKKWNIKDGGNQYAFFTTDATIGKIVLLCAKIR